MTVLQFRRECQAGGLRIALLAILATFALQSFAQTSPYPSKPVRFIVPAAPGGALDVSARLFGTKLSEIWGQQVIVENRPGANGVVGTDAVVRASPDGYTILVASNGAIAVNPVVLSNMPHNPLTDLAPITIAYTSPFMLLVNAAVPANSVRELISLLQASPGKLNHASNTTTTMLASELFKALAKVEYADINYKGASAAVASTSSGETQLCFVDSVTGMSVMRGGRVRALAVTFPERFKVLPDVPTISETVPGYATTAMVIIAAPAKTPPEIVAKLNADFRQALNSADVKAKLDGFGAEVAASTPEETAQQLRAESEKWGRLVKDRNIRVQ